MYYQFFMIKNNIRPFSVLNKSHKQEKQLKRELAKIFLEYMDSLSPTKRIKQMELLLNDTQYKNLPTLDSRLTPQERKCLYLASKGKEIKETARMLGLSQRTIKFHRSNITKKLEVPNLMAAVATDNRYNMLNVNYQTGFNLSYLNILDCNIYCKNKQGYYLWCNKKLANICGLKNQNDIIGKNDFELMSIELAKAVVNLDNAIFKEGKERQTEEIGMDAKKRKAIYFSIKTPIKDELGNVDGLIGISIDITTRKQSEIAKQILLKNMTNDLKRSMDLINFQVQKTNLSKKQEFSQVIFDLSGKISELLNLMTN